ncbi:MAG: YdgA family protein [Azoarcus sp.]|nr:YdgA family protein [Azoarcus sp.]
MGKAVVVAGVVGAAALALVGGSYTIGGYVESGFRDSMTAMSSPGMEIRVLDYKRGVFGAEAHTLWTVTDGDEPLDFRVTHEIDHGPFPTGRAAQVRSDVVLPVELKDEFDAALHGRSPLEVLTLVGWGGEMQHLVSSPDYKGKAGEGLDLVWGGIDGEIRISADRQQAKGRIDLPLLDVRDPDGNVLVVEKLALTLDSARPQQYRFWTGPSALSVGRVSFSAPDGEVRFDMDGLKIESRAALDGEVVNMSVDFGVKQMVGGGETVDDLGFILALERIDAGALDSIARSVEQSAVDTTDIEAQQAELVRALMQQLPVMLKRSPAIELKRVGASLNEGRAEMGARIDYVGKGGEGGMNPFSDLVASLNVSLPKALLVRLIEMSERQNIVSYVTEMEIDASDADIDQAVSAAVNERVAGITGNGVVVEKDGLLTTDMRYKDGALMVNGEALDPRALGALGLPF